MSIFLYIILCFALNLLASSDEKQQVPAQLAPVFSEITPEDYEEARRKQVSPTPVPSPSGPRPETTATICLRSLLTEHFDLQRASSRNKQSAMQNSLASNNSAQANAEQESTSASRTQFFYGSIVGGGLVYSVYKLSSTVKEKTNKSLRRARNLLKKFWEKKKATPVTTGFVLKSTFALGVLYYLRK